jgi:DNA adenine methylase
MRAATVNGEPRTPNPEPRTSNLEPRTELRTRTRNRKPGTWNRAALSARPLLKWAGGKRQLLPVIRPLYPTEFRRYIEPFFGSGAVFFDLHGLRLLGGRRAWLVDANPDLVGCYRMIRDRTGEVIRELRKLAEHHRAGGETFFYEVRDGRFNPARRDGREGYTPELAAMLIYLNRTGFNGLFRLNRRGDFNVPAGRYVNPCICDESHLRTVAGALGQPGVTIELGSFEKAIARAGQGDFVYCDPPYEPLSATARFASYTADGFTAADQARLQREIVAAARRGAHVVLSNSSAPLIVSLYTSDEVRAAGLRLHRVPARRAINSRAALRGPVDEVLVTNAAVPALPVIRPAMAKARLRRRAAEAC